MHKYRMTTQLTGVYILLLCCPISIAQEVATTHGRVRGSRISVLGKTVDTFFGIPFAKPPIGDLRFKHPEDLNPWGTEVKDAFEMKASCQQTFFPSENSSLGFTPGEISEDCLYLNAWVPPRPSDGSKLSTMVWIYGGAFVIGSVQTLMYDGKYLAAENDVIVFSINYRVGVLGFLYLGEDTFPGNQGMVDQSIALKWIHQNVEAFGGDRNMITIFGESAGGVSVGHHLLSPMSRDYFTRAILQSGASQASWGYTTPSQARANTIQFAKAMNCSDHSELEMYNCIRGLSASQLLQGQLRMTSLITNFPPVVDGNFLPDDPNIMVESGNMKKANILLGVVKDEGTYFLTGIDPNVYQFTNEINVTKDDFKKTTDIYAQGVYGSRDLDKPIFAQYVKTNVASQLDYTAAASDMLGDDLFKCPVAKLADSMSKWSNIYLYTYEARPVSTYFPQWMGVAHSSEVEVVFGHQLGDFVTSTQEGQNLSQTVMTYWANLAKSGNPNSPTPVSMQWPVYDLVDERMMVLDFPVKQRIEQGFRKQECVFWNDLVPLLLEKTSAGETTEKVVIMPCVSGGSELNINAILTISLVSMATATMSYTMS